MAKEFILALMRCRHTAWNVQLSTSYESERFVTKEGAFGWIDSVISTDKPVQVLIFHPNSDQLQESWFIENKVKRKLHVIVIAEANTKKGNW